MTAKKQTPEVRASDFYLVDTDSDRVIETDDSVKKFPSLETLYKDVCEHADSNMESQVDFDAIFPSYNDFRSYVESLEYELYEDLFSEMIGVVNEGYQNSGDDALEYAEDLIAEEYASALANNFDIMSRSTEE